MFVEALGNYNKTDRRSPLFEVNGNFVISLSGQLNCSIFNWYFQWFLLMYTIFFGLASTSIQFLHKIATLSTVTFLQIQFCSDFSSQSRKFEFGSVLFESKFI